MVRFLIKTQLHTGLLDFRPIILHDLATCHLPVNHENGESPNSFLASQLKCPSTYQLLQGKIDLGTLKNCFLSPENVRKTFPLPKKQNFCVFISDLKKHIITSYVIFLQFFGFRSVFNLNKIFVGNFISSISFSKNISNVSENVECVFRISLATAICLLYRFHLKSEGKVPCPPKVKTMISRYEKYAANSSYRNCEIGKL